VAATGFPARLGVSVAALHLDDPASGFRWQLPQLDLAAPVWAPLDWQAQAALPQWLTLAGQRFELTGDSAAAAARFGLGPDLPLRGAGLHLAAPSLRAEAATGPSLAAQRLDVDVTSQDDPGSYQVTARLDALALPPGLVKTLAPGAQLPDLIERLSVEASVAFVQPLAALAQTGPKLRSVSLTEAALVWDGHRLSASGGVTVAPDGTLAGTITLAVSDWPVWLDLALAAGLVPPERKPMLASMAGYLAKQSPDGAVRVPLSFANGWMSLAALPLGPAPKLR
jgi:hypothetical protein